MKLCKKRKSILLGITVGILGVFLYSSWLMERDTCMNVLLIRENDLRQLTQTLEPDLEQLTFEGKRPAIDWIGSRIFISQPLEAIRKGTLYGTLGTENPEYSLYFLKTDAIENIAQAVSEGDPLTLIVRCGNDYQKVDLVVTPLPVLSLGLKESSEDGQGNVILSGDLTLWNSADAELDLYQTSRSEAQWHIRGNSSRIRDKKSWKLNLKENGTKKNLDLLGLGSDDDWILNPMSMDDTKLKEKLAQTLWNQQAEAAGWNAQMSGGEYVELLINGAYQGLYLLQRRVDTKYLALDKNTDILLKGKNIWQSDSKYQSCSEGQEDGLAVSEAYEIVSSPFGEEETWQIFEHTLSLEENEINWDNFIDVNLFLQLLSAGDNTGYKNMFYILKEQAGNYELSWIPWDTDLSWGVTWEYEYEESMAQIAQRHELEAFRENFPEIDKKIANRWKQLRRSVYSEAAVFSVYEKLADSLDKSGALQRDASLWGDLHEGSDSRENLERFLRERLAFLDQYYAEE